MGASDGGTLWSGGTGGDLFFFVLGIRAPKAVSMRGLTYG